MMTYNSKVYDTIRRKYNRARHVTTLSIPDKRSLRQLLSSYRKKALDDIFTISPQLLETSCVRIDAETIGRIGASFARGVVFYQPVQPLSPFPPQPSFHPDIDNHNTRDSPVNALMHISFNDCVGVQYLYVSLTNG